MQEDDVENTQYSAETSGDGNSDQSGSGEMQVEGQATQAPAAGVKRFAEVVVQRDCDTRDRSSNEPIPDSDMDMNSILTNEQCEQTIQSVLKDLGFTVRKNLVENSTWYGLIQASVIDVTTMNLIDELVQSKCEMTLQGQKPTLFIGGPKGAEEGELNEPLKSFAVCV